MHDSYRYRPSPGGRATAALLSLAILALIVLALIRMGLIGPSAGKPGERLEAVTFPARSADRAERKAAVKTVQSQQRQAVVRPQVTPAVPPTPKQVPPPLQIIKLTHDEFAAADISKMARHSADSDSEGAGPNGAAAYGPGEGPGGARLYNAQWYREPTHAELVTYLPHRDIGGGWAMIACKTEDHYHVEDCQELSESPPGSGLARALRQAAWQFLVRPPRIDGKPVIGAWVRIRFDFTKVKVEGGGDAAGG